MAASEQQMSDGPPVETGADRIAAAALFLAVLVPIIGLVFGWGSALDALEVIGILGGIAILVWNLQRWLSRIVAEALYIALTGLAIGLVVDWEQAGVIVAVAVGTLIWARWRDRHRPAH